MTHLAHVELPRLVAMCHHLGVWTSRCELVPLVVHTWRRRSTLALRYDLGPSQVGLTHLGRLPSFFRPRRHCAAMRLDPLRRFVDDLLPVVGMQLYRSLNCHS